jgi:hypothetical protein
MLNFKNNCLKIVFPKVNLVVEFWISNVFMVFIIILINYWKFQILVINNYDGFQQLNFPFPREIK